MFFAIESALILIQDSFCIEEKQAQEEISN